MKSLRAGVLGLCLVMSLPLLSVPERAAWANPEESVEWIRQGLLRREVDIACSGPAKSPIRGDISRAVEQKLAAKVEAIRAQIAGLQQYLADPGAGASRQLAEEQLRPGVNLALRLRAARLEAQIATRRTLAEPVLAELKRLAETGDRYEVLRKRAQECAARAAPARSTPGNAVPIATAGELAPQSPETGVPAAEMPAPSASGAASQATE